MLRKQKKLGEKPRTEKKEKKEAKENLTHQPLGEILVTSVD